MGCSPYGAAAEKDLLSQWKIELKDAGVTKLKGEI